jgi:hypothetical protein
MMGQSDSNAGGAPTNSQQLLLQQQLQNLRKQMQLGNRVVVVDINAARAVGQAVLQCWGDGSGPSRKPMQAQQQQSRRWQRSRWRKLE